MEKHNSDHFAFGVVAIIFASILSSLGWVFEGEAVKRIDPIPAICVSLIVGGTAQLAFAYLTGQRPRSGISSISAAYFVLFSVVRSSFLCLYFAYCLTITSSSKAMFLTKIEPYIVLLLHIVLYGHRTTWQHLLLLAVHLAGAVYLSTGGEVTLSRDILGDFLIFVGVVCNALLYRPSQYYSHALGPLFAGGGSQLLGGVLLIPFTLMWGLSAFVPSESNLIGWWYVFLTVLVFYIFSTALWFFSLKSVPAWLASALRCVGPVVAAPCAWLFFNQHFTPPQIAGAITVIVTSVVMVVLERREAEGEGKKPELDDVY